MRSQLRKISFKSCFPVLTSALAEIDEMEESRSLQSTHKSYLRVA